MKEALYINMKDPAMNKDKGMELSPAWIEVVTSVSSKPKIENSASADLSR